MGGLCPMTGVLGKMGLSVAQWQRAGRGEERTQRQASLEASCGTDHAVASRDTGQSRHFAGVQPQARRVAATLSSGAVTGISGG